MLVVVVVIVIVIVMVIVMVVVVYLCFFFVIRLVLMKSDGVQVYIFFNENNNKNIIKSLDQKIIAFSYYIYYFMYIYHTDMSPLSSLSLPLYLYFQNLSQELVNEELAFTIGKLGPPPLISQQTAESETLKRSNNNNTMNRVCVIE